MTKDEIIEMAREVWLSDYGVQAICRGGEVEMDLETLQSFAKLVADHEREKCAKVADVWSGHFQANEIAKTIRERNND